MMEQDSMTPPSSPHLEHGGVGNEMIVEAMMTDFSQLQGSMNTSNVEDNQASWEPLCFVCEGDYGTNNQDTNKHSFLHRSQFERFLQNNLSHLLANYNSITVELFGYHFCASTALFDEIDKLFFLLRKRISKMELMLPKFSTSSGNDMLEDRMCVRQFFDYILAFLKSFAGSCTEAKLCQNLIGHLKGVLLHVDRLAQLPPGVLTAASTNVRNKSSSLSHHLFHLHLEVHWAVIEVFHYISVNFPGHINTVNMSKSTSESGLLDGDLFLQTVHLIIWDVIQLAIFKYKNNNPREVMCTSPFQCSCVKELIILLRHLLNHRQQHQAKESMMILLQPILMYILKFRSDEYEQAGMQEGEVEIYSDMYLLPPDVDCSDQVGFVWWFMTGLVSTYQYDLHGTFCPHILDKTQEITFNYILLQLARKSIRMSELQLRKHLRFCLDISHSFNANIQILSVFWDQFYKRLNDTYSLTSNPLGHLQSINKTASGLLESSKIIVMNDPKNVESASSFILFLHLLCVELQKSDKKGTTNQEWKSMKGRFYSKFHSRRMQELSELGLQHFALLFLCLAEVADTQDVVQKMCDLYGTFNVANLPVPRRSAIWQGSFATILLLVEKSCDVSFLTEKMATSFSAVVTEIMTANTDVSKYSEMWPLVNLYIESTQEIFELSSLLNLHQHLLLCGGFQGILKVCRECDLRKLLCFVDAILTKHRILCQRPAVVSNVLNSGSHFVQKQELNNALWKYFFTFVKEHSCTLTPPTKIADLAAGFTLLVLSDPPHGCSGIREDLVSCFGFFAWNEQVNSRISCRFLCHLLPNEETMDTLSRLIVDLDKKLIQAWVKCSLELGSAEEEISELTRLLVKIPSIYEVMNDPALLLDSDLPILNFIRSLGQKYSILQDLRSKTEFREKVGHYFTAIPKVLNILLKNCTSGEKMCNVYNIAGHLIKECASLLYLKSKPDCLLPVIVDKLALPRIITQNKPVPSHILEALKGHLHLFIEGLGKLDYKRDPYVQRKLKDLVIHHMTRYPVGTAHQLAASSVHPLMMALNNTFSRNVSEESSNFRRYFVKTISMEYLSLRGTAVPLNANLGWNFVLDMINRTTNGEEVAKDSLVLLKTVLDYMLIVENNELKTKSTRVMQYMIENTGRYPQSADQKVLCSILQHFFETNMKMYPATKVIKILESISVLCPNLLLPMIKIMTTAIISSEAKRGVGIDKQLRMTYYNILNQLGEEGNKEKVFLLRSSGS